MLAGHGGRHAASKLHTILAVQGMLQSEALGQFYKDLKDPNVESVYAVYHRRFSTNTNPKWPLAQPMRVLGHNGAHARSEW